MPACLLRLLPLAAAAVLAPIRAFPAPEPWRPDRSRGAATERARLIEAAGADAASSVAEPGAEPGAAVVPAAHTPPPRTPSLTEAVLALPILAEHRDDRGRLVRLARDPSGAIVRYAISADGRIAELEVWPAGRR